MASRGLVSPRTTGQPAAPIRPGDALSHTDDPEIRSDFRSHETGTWRTPLRGAGRSVGHSWPPADGQRGVPDGFRTEARRAGRTRGQAWRRATAVAAWHRGRIRDRRRERRGHGARPWPTPEQTGQRQSEKGKTPFSSLSSSSPRLVTFRGGRAPPRTHGGRGRRAGGMDAD